MSLLFFYVVFPVASNQSYFFPNKTYKWGIAHFGKPVLMSKSPKFKTAELFID